MSAAKFAVGQRVRAKVQSFEWEGTIIHRNDASASGASPDWEYLVDNGPWTHGFPLLAWESELTLVT